MQDKYLEAVELYKNGKSIIEISKIVGISRPKISQYFKDNNIPIRGKHSDEDYKKYYDMFLEIGSITRTAEITGVSKGILRQNWKRLGLRDYESKYDNQYDDKIIELYNSYMTMEEVANELGIPETLVSTCLRYHNLTRKRTNAYTFDQSTFKQIDTEEKAYWLGFLYADGYVCADRGIELSLQEADYEHLVKFKDFLKSTQNIKYREHVKAYRISIESLELAQDLINLGCVQAKSKILTFPTLEQVPEHLVHHFMRGYFDGDGCISSAVSHGNEQHKFSVLGTPEFLDAFEKYLLKGISRDISKKNKRIHRYDWSDRTEDLSYGGNQQVYKIFQFLYKDATIYLDRKYEKFIYLQNAVLGQKENKKKS